MISAGSMLVYILFAMSCISKYCFAYQFKLFSLICLNTCGVMNYNALPLSVADPGVNLILSPIEFDCTVCHPLRRTNSGGETGEYINLAPS